MVDFMRGTCRRNRPAAVMSGQRIAKGLHEDLACGCFPRRGFTQHKTAFEANHHRLTTGCSSLAVGKIKGIPVCLAQYRVMRRITAICK